jgi:arylsulfatase A-like enzyme
MSSFRTATLLALLTASLHACTCGGGAKTPKRDVAPDGEAKTYMLAVDTLPTAIQVPADVRGGAVIPDVVPIRGLRPGPREGRGAFVAPMPIRTRNFYFFRPPAGLEMVDATGAVVPHASRLDKAATATTVHWSWTNDEVRLHNVATAPADGAYGMRWEEAKARETRMHQGPSGLQAAAFVATTGQVDQDSRQGLLAPAPATLTWDLIVPPAADLRFDAALLPPEFADLPASDGAEVAVTLTTDDGAATTLWTDRLQPGPFEPVAVDLGAYARQHVTLSIQTRAGGNAINDFVFLAEPMISSRRAKPRRVVMVFVDTLRPDHMSAYGHDRPTTPATDAIAADGVRFSAARNVAPWTLPSTRSVLTGRQPEAWDSATTLPEHLRRAGFATAMFAGNMYLSSNFGIERGWGTHAVELLPRAEQQLDKALAWWDDHEGLDAMMMLHLMDAHLPYKEPAKYRTMFAGDAPPSLTEDAFHREQVMRANLKPGAERQYVRDRYDNSIRYLDDQLARLYAVLSPDDIVVFFSDHGEEFWEHGGYEHGHALFDELLHVPLIVRAPGLQGVVDAPVSLLDVAPTVLDLVGLSAEGMDGRSLVQAMRGQADAVAALRDRPQAFGRPLYGGERWGALHDGQKSMSQHGITAVFDLTQDAAEKQDLAKGDPSRTTALQAAMKDALGRDVVQAIQLWSRTLPQPPADDLRAEVRLPGGIAAAWVGEDPTEASLATVAVVGDTARIVWPAGYRGSRNVWVVPNEPLDAAWSSATVRVAAGAACAQLDPTRPTGPRGVRHGARVGDRGVDVGPGLTPLPLQGGTRLSGASRNLAAELEAMGYAVASEGAAAPTEGAWTPIPTSCAAPAAEASPAAEP